jgi:hypothetical protein
MVVEVNIGTSMSGPSACSLSCRASEHGITHSARGSPEPTVSWHLAVFSAVVVSVRIFSDSSSTQLLTQNLGSHIIDFDDAFLE